MPTVETLRIARSRPVVARMAVIKFLWISKLYACTTDDAIDEAVLLLYEKVDDLLIEKKFAECNMLLERIDIGRLCTELQVGLLRITYPAREHLPQWKIALSNIHKRLSEKKHNVAALLQGLQEHLHDGK